MKWCGYLLFFILFAILYFPILYHFFYPSSISKSLQMSQSIKQVLSYPPNTRFLFWTGGYDSTFRLGQILHTTRDPVLPIYINDPKMDGDNVARKNRSQEMVAMSNILQLLYKIDPSYRSRIYPTLVIHHIPISPTVRTNMYRLYRKGLNRRPITQYAAMAELSLLLGKRIEVGVENSDHSAMRRMIRADLVPHSRIPHILILDLSSKALKERRNPEVIIFRNLDYPIIEYTKEAMLEEAKRGRYDTILRNSWSCWFPVNGRACGKCAMCSERIL
jgi:hypothetical protein